MKKCQNLHLRELALFHGISFDSDILPRNAHAAKKGTE